MSRTRIIIAIASLLGLGGGGYLATRGGAAIAPEPAPEGFDDDDTGDDDTTDEGFPCCPMDSESCCIDLPTVCDGQAHSAIARLDRKAWARTADAASPIDFDKAAMTLRYAGGSPVAVSIVDGGGACGLDGEGVTLRIKWSGSAWEIQHTSASLNPGSGWGVWAGE